jgi:hypothetical protein
MRLMVDRRLAPVQMGRPDAYERFIVHNPFSRIVSLQAGWQAASFPPSNQSPFRTTGNGLGSNRFAEFLWDVYGTRTAGTGGEVEGVGIGTAGAAHGARTTVTVAAVHPSEAYLIRVQYCERC